MTTSSFTTIILKSEPNHYLTQKECDDIRERLIATTIALGKNDSADNYIEIDAKTAEKYQQEQKEAIEADAQN